MRVHALGLLRATVTDAKDRGAKGGDASQSLARHGSQSQAIEKTRELPYSKLQAKKYTEVGLMLLQILAHSTRTTRQRFRCKERSKLQKAGKENMLPIMCTSSSASSAFHMSRVMSSLLWQRRQRSTQPVQRRMKLGQVQRHCT